MALFQQFIKTFDTWQQRHRLPAFVSAVFQKYSHDETRYQAALLTYYGFLSLFPLLLVATTLASMVTDQRPHLQEAIVDSIVNYFPVLGNQLSEHVHSLHKTGLALVIGLLIALYGARGVADAFQHSIADMWEVPRSKRDGYIRRLSKSLSLLAVAGLGLLGASIITGLALTAGHGMLFHGFSIAINVFMFFWLFDFVLNICLPKHVKLRDARAGALAAAIGLVTLQTFGGIILGRTLKNLDALYSSFAIPLGLLFWIYLQAVVVYFAVEIVAVKAHKLWPRSLLEPDQKITKKPNS